MIIDQYVFAPKEKQRTSRLKLMWGKVKCFVNDMTGYKEKKYSITTNTAIIGVRGTVFVVWQLDDGSTRVAAFENDVFVETRGMGGGFRSGRGRHGNPCSVGAFAHNPRNASPRW